VEKGPKTALKQNSSFFDEGMEGTSGRPCKKPKSNQSLVSEISTSPFEMESEKAKSEILFPGLHLLAGVAVRLLEIDVADFLQNDQPMLHDIQKNLSAANSE
jgi:hypothetical protein